MKGDAFARQRSSKRAFRKRLRQLGYPSYAAYLRSPHWQQRKRDFRRSKLIQSCRRCGNSRTQLHHRTYQRLGKERLTDLVALCGSCHEFLHQLEQDGVVGLDGQEPRPFAPLPAPLPPLDKGLELWVGKHGKRAKAHRNPVNPELKRKFGGYLAKQSAKANRHPQRDGQVRPDPTTANGGATASATPVATPVGEAASQSKAGRG